MATRNVSYKVKCRSCGREFIVRKPMSLLPEHPLKVRKQVLAYIYRAQVQATLVFL
jgi:hypothetical protein